MDALSPATHELLVPRDHQLLYRASDTAIDQVPCTILSAALLTRYSHIKIYSHLLPTTNSTQDMEKVSDVFAIDPSFVGKAMAREVAEVYYKTYDFQVFLENHATLLDDPFNLGVTPCCWIRSLQVGIDANLSRAVDASERTRRASELHANASALAATLLSADRKDASSLSVSVVLLTFFRRSTNPSPLRRTTALDDEQEIAAWLDVLRHPVYDLRHTFENVRISQENFADDSYKYGTRDLGSWFCLGRGEVEKVSLVPFLNVEV